MFSLLILSACGGGSGGGNSVSGGQNMLRPSVTPTETKVRNSNLVISSNIDNESKRSEHVINTLGEDYYSSVSNGMVSNGRASSRSPRPQNPNPKDYCSNPRECNDIAFNNMKKWLIDNISDSDNWTDNKELRNALILAGFKSELSGNWDDIKEWVRDNLGTIQKQAEDIYSDIGEHQDFDITKSDLSVISHMDGDAKVKFVFNNSKEISGIEYIINHTPDIASKLTGERIDDKDTRFNMNAALYRYTLTGIGIQYDPASEVDGGREITLISDKPLELSEAQAKLRQLIAYYKEQGIFFNTFHTWPGGELPAGKTQEQAIIDALYGEVLARINGLENMEELELETETIKGELDFQSAGKKLGLAYSDFGFVRFDGQDEIFHGGYPDNKIELATVRDLNKDMNFKGSAIGIVETSTETSNGSETTGRVELNGNADLLVANNGKETLTVNFDKWYNVTVERNTDDTNKITFSDYHNENDSFKFKYVNEGGSLVERGDTPYAVDNFTTPQTPHFNYQDTETTGQTEGSMILDYFGPKDKNNPTEFSGIVMYHESVPYNQNNGHYDNVDGVHFMMGIGGKKEY